MIIEKSRIPDHLLKYFKLKEKKTIIHRGYISHLCDIFDEVKRVLRKDGTCWVNLGDTYGGTKKGNDNPKMNKVVRTKSFTKSGGVTKSLCQIPSRFAIEMTNRGWILRNEIIWYKSNVMPSSVKDRFTVDFEKIFFFTKNKKYWFKQQFESFSKNYFKKNRLALEHFAKVRDWQDGMNRRGKDAIIKIHPEKGRNKRCVWKIPTKPFKEAHFATFPKKLIETPIKAGCPENGTVLDPFAGAGTTGVVAKKQNKNFIGIELNPKYIEIAQKRINNTKRQLELF